MAVRTHWVIGSDPFRAAIVCYCHRDRLHYTRELDLSTPTRMRHETHATAASARDACSRPTARRVMENARAEFGTGVAFHWLLLVVVYFLALPGLEVVRGVVAAAQEHDVVAGTALDLVGDLVASFFGS